MSDFGVQFLDGLCSRNQIWINNIQKHEGSMITIVVGSLWRFDLIRFDQSKAMNVWVADRPFSLSAITAWRPGSPEIWHSSWKMIVERQAFPFGVSAYFQGHTLKFPGCKSLRSVLMHSWAMPQLGEATKRGRSFRVDLAISGLRGLTHEWCQLMSWRDGKKVVEEAERHVSKILFEKTSKLGHCSDSTCVLRMFVFTLRLDLTYINILSANTQLWRLTIWNTTIHYNTRTNL